MKINVYQTPLAAGIPLPRRAFASDVGYDLRTVRDLSVAPGEFVMVPTGLIFDLPIREYRIGGLPHRLALVIEPRTGRGRDGLIPVARIVDAGYRPARTDENGLTLALRNVGKNVLELARGDAVAQAVCILLPVPVLFPVSADKIRFKTDRGEGRFGSTGR